MAHLEHQGIATEAVPMTLPLSTCYAFEEPHVIEDRWQEVIKYNRKGIDGR